VPVAILVIQGVGSGILVVRTFTAR
jgi:hypothetical protein